MFLCSLSVFIPFQEINIILSMKLGQILLRCSPGPIHIHFLVQLIIEDQVVCYCQPVWLHFMPRAVMEIAHILIIEIRHLGRRMRRVRNDMKVSYMLCWRSCMKYKRWNEKITKKRKRIPHTLGGLAWLMMVGPGSTMM